MYSSRPLRPGYGFSSDSMGSYPLLGGPGLGMSGGGSLFGGTPQPLKQREISFDTSSKEPHLMRARVFVGNMNTNLITRDDIIRLFSSYGNLLGVTVFKGYAFIQYATGNEADLAVSALNNYSWNGSVLDVKLAIAGMKSHNVPSTVSSSNGTKRGADTWMNSGNTSVKKERLEEVSTAIAQNEKNRQTAMCFSTENSGLFNSGMSDTLICGACRFVTSDLEKFIDHRKEPCGMETAKDDGEPMQCSMCEETCNTPLALINHALNHHNIHLLKVNKSD